MAYKTDVVFLWNYLAEKGKFEIIDLLARAEKHEIHKVKIKRRLVPDQEMHDFIVSFLKKNDVEVQCMPESPK